MALGAQDCFWENGGAYTGEISPQMLKNLGCSYVILGHSERKRFVNETLEMVKKKVEAVLKADLTPIVCIGEKERGDIGSVERQVEEIFGDLVVTSPLILVYEPEWAISSNDGKAATSQEAIEGISVVRKKAEETLGEAEICVLYGGSVNPMNVHEFLGQGKADGVLVGYASLNSQEFVELVKRGTVR